MKNVEYQPLFHQSGAEEDDDGPPNLQAHASNSNSSSLPLNLDIFFTQIYIYYKGRGVSSIALAGLLNSLALAFTIASSALCLLFIDWKQFKAPCIIEDSCDIFPTVLFKNPLTSRGLISDILILSYLSIFILFWLWSTYHYVYEMSSMARVSRFMKETLGISDRHLSVMTWAELVSRLVILQQTRKLSITRTLDEHDIVSRIMRKENYMIALVNSGILSTSITLPTWLSFSPLSLFSSRKSSRLSSSDRGRRKLETLTKTIEWNIKWCLLDEMFDERFEIKSSFIAEPERLARGMFRAGLVNLLLSPFLVVFLFIYFFMHNAERFYSSPGAISTRRWTSLAKWRMRELNELPHYLSLRLYAARGPADKYLQQFPNPTLVSLARFVSFVAGSLAALVLMVTLMDEKLLERSLLGRHLVWWIAFLGVILAASRSMAGDGDEALPYDPEGAVQELATFTHWMPRHWRGRAHEKQVQRELSSMYQLKVWTFIEEMASVLLTPLLLMWVLPRRAEMITEFIQSCTVKVPGVGDVCSYATFDLKKHGNAKYGSTPTEGLVSTLLRPTPMAPSVTTSWTGGIKGGKSSVIGGPHAKAKQGKVEKSLVTFASTYPTWQPSDESSIMQQMEEIERQTHQVEGHGRSANPGGTFLNSNEPQIQGWSGSRSAHVAIDMTSSSALFPGTQSHMIHDGAAHTRHLLPLNEGGDLAQILRLRHSLLSHLYISNEPTVQHRMHHSQSKRSMMMMMGSSSLTSSLSHDPVGAAKVSKSLFSSSHASSSIASQSSSLAATTAASASSSLPTINSSRLPSEATKINQNPTNSHIDAPITSSIAKPSFAPAASSSAPSFKPAPASIELMEADPNPLLGFCP